MANLDDDERADRSSRIRKICDEAVRWHATSGLKEAERTKPRAQSLYRFHLEKIAEAAAAYANERKVEQDDFDSNILEKGLAVVDDVRYALTGDWSGPLNFWRSDQDPMTRIRGDDVPKIDRSLVESAVGDYLALPYRSQALDRLLINILIAMELYAFGDEMFNEKTFGFPPISPLKQRHALLTYLRGQIINAILFFGIAGLAVFANGQGLLSEGWVWGLTGTAVSLFLALLAASTLALPFGWHAQRKARRRVYKFLASMLEVYRALRSDGPISAHHVRKKVEDTTAKGVVWPAPLFALLDDILARSGRF